MPKRSRKPVCESFHVEDLPTNKRWRPWRSRDEPANAADPATSTGAEAPEAATGAEVLSDTNPNEKPSGNLVPYFENTSVKSEIIPIFDPEKSDIFAHQWLNKIEQLALIYNWSNSVKSYYMQSRLGGMARVWHSSLLNYDLTWDDWKEEFLKAFPHNIDFAEALREMLARKKDNHETMAQYYYQKNALLTKLDITGEKSVACLIDGLPMYLKAPARAGNYKDATELYSKFLNIMEDTRNRQMMPRQINSTTKLQNTESPSNSSVSQQNRTLKKLVCFLCQDSGHTVRRCPKNANRPTCNNCGKIGHTEDKCWSKIDKLQNSTTQSTSTVNLISNEVNDAYFKNVKINGIDVIAYFDSGAKINVASPEISKKIESPALPCNMLIRGFGGSLIQAQNSHRVQISIDDIHFDTTLIVVNWGMQRMQVILGQPIINDPKIEFIISGATLKIQENKQEPLSDILGIEDIRSPDHIQVNCSEDVVLAPLSKMVIKVDIQNNIEGDNVFVESRSCHSEVRNYSIPSTMLSGQSGMINVSNQSCFPLLLEKGDLLARGKRCDEIVPKQSSCFVPTSSNIESVLSIDIKDIQCDTKDPDLRQKLIDLLQEYSDCFSYNTKELGCTDKIKMEIKLDCDKPVCYRPYRMSLPEKAIVREKVKDLMDNNIIRESDSPYSSPIILVKKKDGDYRLCVDFRKLNSVTIKDRYPLPIIEDQIEKLGGKNVFTSLDMSQGFYQIPLHEESIPKTGFITPEGHYEFLRMPFGLANSPSVYQRLMDKILGSLRFNNVLPYMDDLLIASTDEAEALDTLKIVLNIIRDAKLTLNLRKCNFLQNEIQYLGYDISKDGIRPGEKKIESVTKFRQPTNVHELRMFLGLTSYFRKFVKGYAVIAHDLYQLLKKDEPWIWAQPQQKAFENLKRILTTRPVLALYNHAAETEVHTDASSKGIAGILLQKSGDSMRPVAYFSRKTSKEESVYHSYELETLAVVESLKRFRIYLAGIEFVVVTDCTAVRETFQKRDLLHRIARWWLNIQEYKFTVVHRPGKSHQHVDALSRAPLTESNDIVAEVLVLDLTDWIVCTQNQDSQLQIIRDKLERNDDDPDITNNYVLKENKLYRKCMTDQLRLVIPKYGRWNVMRKFHDDAGHLGLKKCETLIKESCWFPKMSRFIRKYINSCLDCAYKRGQYGKLEGELHPIKKVDEPLHTLHIDHVGPFCKSQKGFSYLFVIVDSFTKFVWAKPCRTTKSAEAIDKLLDIFNLFGYPKRIVSDRGTAFTSKSFKDFCTSHQIKHVMNAVASPRSNGQVERYNRTLLEAINKSTKDEKDWDLCLGKVVWGINNTVNTSTGFPAYRLMFKASRGLFQGMSNNIVDDEQTAQENRERAKQNIAKTATAMKNRFDAKRRKPTKYEVNDLVLWKKSEAASKDASRKLKQKYSGPYKITKCLGNDRYVITALKGLKGYKKFSAIVANDVLRKFHNDTETESDSDDSSVDSTEELIDLLEG